MKTRCDQMGLMYTKGLGRTKNGRHIVSTMDGFCDHHQTRQAPLQQVQTPLQSTGCNGLRKPQEVRRQVGEDLGIVLVVHGDDLAR